MTMDFHTSVDMVIAMEEWTHAMQESVADSSTPNETEAKTHRLRRRLANWGVWEAAEDTPRGDDGAKVFEASIQSYQEASKIAIAIKKRWPEFKFEFEFIPFQNSIVLTIINDIPKN